MRAWGIRRPHVGGGIWAMEHLAEFFDAL